MFAHTHAREQLRIWQITDMQTHALSQFKDPSTSCVTTCEGQNHALFYEHSHMCLVIQIRKNALMRKCAIFINIRKSALFYKCVQIHMFKYLALRGSTNKLTLCCLKHASTACLTQREHLE